MRIIALLPHTCTIGTKIPYFLSISPSNRRIQTFTPSSAISSASSASIHPSFARNPAVFLSFLGSTVRNRCFFDIDHVFLIPKDRYEKGRKLGEGCSGKVYEG